jgi:hypothetical protein
MNADTGRVYQLGSEFVDGRPVLDSAHFMSQIATLERELTDDEAAARDDLERGDRIFPVSDTVAQTMKLGERERERRRKRRKAQRDARKRNRT